MPIKVKNVYWDFDKEQLKIVTEKLRKLDRKESYTIVSSKLLMKGKELQIKYPNWRVIEQQAIDYEREYFEFANSILDKELEGTIPV